MEMDMSDGEVQLKLVQRSVEMHAHEVAELIMMAIYTMNTFLPGILAVTFADQSPERAFNDCENARREGREATASQGQSLEQ